jgi:uncharacterized protein
MKKELTVFIGATIFGVGLAYSGMTKPEVVLSFLQLNDLGLLILMGTAVLISGLTFFFLSHSGKKAPLTHQKYGIRNYPLDKNIVIGAIIFGIGWGLSGICPGAGFASLGTGNFPVLIAIFGMMIGVTLLKVSTKGKYPLN